MGLARKFLKRFGLGRNLLRAQKLYRADQKHFQGVLPGHFYSPIPNHEEVRRNSARIFDQSHKRLGKPKEYLAATQVACAQTQKRRPERLLVVPSAVQEGPTVVLLSHRGNSAVPSPK